MNEQELVSLFSFHEEQLIKIFLNEIINRNPTQEEMGEKDLVKYNLIRKDKFNISFLTHRFIIQKLIDFSFQKFFNKKNKSIKVYHFDFTPKIDFQFQLLSKLTPIEFGDFLERLHINFLNSEFSFQNGNLKRKKSKIHLKESGSVYTQNYIAEKIVSKVIENCIQNGSITEELNILDFGCGTGRFYSSAFKILNQKYNLPKTKIIQNLYALDLNDIALAILKTKILLQVGLQNLEILEKNILQKNMLISKNQLNFENNNYLDFQNDFKEVFLSGGFDAVVSNPPYFLLKINKKNSNDIAQIKYYQYLSNKINTELKYFRNSGFYQYSIEGMLNYYKISIEMMLKLLKPLGELGIICPSTLFGDLSSKKLRKFLLSKNQLHQIEFFGEQANLFENVSQATAIFFLRKEGTTQKIKIVNSKKSFSIPFELIKKTFSKNFEIPQMEKIGWGILKKLNQFKKIKEFENLRNRRGEFDLLQFKSLITSEKTSFTLVRGNMINCESIDYEKQKEFVKIEEFKRAKSEIFLNSDFKKVRLICQQISNIHVAKRLKFVACEKNDILANSCNYISIDDFEHFEKLKILLNTHILNWRFKVTSTNNHINNYELDELPLIDYTKLQDSLNGDELKNNIEIAKMYGLNEKEIQYLLKDFYSQEQIETYL